MPRILIVDPANPARDGWHELYGNDIDALAGNVSRVFLTRVPFSVPTSKCRQPDDWSCGPHSMAECLGQPNGEEARQWLLTRGLINPDYGTSYDGITGYLSAKGYYCDYDGIPHDGEMKTSIFEKIANNLSMGYKVILCMHGTRKGCRTDYWTRGGHYVCAYGIDGVGRDSYMFDVNGFGLGSEGNNVLLVQEILRSRGIKGADDKDLTLDGKCGNNTVHAVKWYQKYINNHGGKLRTDGFCDKATIANMIGL